MFTNFEWETSAKKRNFFGQNFPKKPKRFFGLFFKILLVAQKMLVKKVDKFVNFFENTPQVLKQFGGLFSN